MVIHVYWCVFSKNVFIPIFINNCYFCCKIKMSSRPVNEMRPLPSLRSKEESTTNNSCSHPTYYTSLIISMSSFNGKNHRN